MPVADGGRNDFIVESKLRYSDPPITLCLAYVYVWFTSSDSPNWTVT